ncbi:hypothetical protein O7635_22475 [Asanoa sp. WMMD1127]|uniref:hypothetical protein n=1 Tax=Asanoa sp. WMMD1127 TaxID=3016107 RepID=UPI002415E531|nr:hypothetical protein [Asanoa sp. WMMD1127]MDG4824625.1 hypothetical protein [Asanoa sp. WMMD1127]
MTIMGEASMFRNRLVLTGAAVVAVLAMSACDTEPAAESAATSAPAAPTSAAPTTAAATTAPAVDGVTAKACADIKKDIEDNADKVAEAEKIGPPAGHIAVSAQWTAGSAAVIAHAIGANPTVSAAADKVQQEMMALGDAYNKSAKAKPSKKKLEAAIKELNIACSAA